MKTTDEVWSEYVALRENAPEPRPLVKARKSHFCELCGTTIRPGSLYVRETIFPGDFNDNDVPVLYKAHIECDQLALVKQS
ncbi:MAG: hypothetical protein M1272_07905, partial [Firmicutes bacterium]|nr:hypothetical protein [Bacillota bacterium]